MSDDSKVDIGERLKRHYIDTNYSDAPKDFILKSFELKIASEELAAANIRWFAFWRESFDEPFKLCS